GIIATNQPAFVAAMFALWGIGAVAVPIAARSTVPEIERLLAHSRAKAVLCDPLRSSLARAAASTVGLAAFACEPDLPLRPRILRRAAAASTHAPRAPQPKSLAVLAYTSGTTGAPKGVMLTHANLFWAALACATARGDRPDGVGACMSPLTHA